MPWSSPQALREEVAEMSVADLLDRFPASRPVVFNHFGASCFACPARTEETVALAIRVHDSLTDRFYEDLYRVLAKAPDERKEDRTQ